MADFLPRLDDFIPGYSDSAPPPAYKKPVAPAPVKPGSVYASLTDEQKKQADLLMEPRSALGEVGAGFARGATYELPKLVGQALQAPGKPGDTLYDAGTAIQDYTKGNNARFLEDQNPDAHNMVTDAFAKGASMIAPSLAPLALLPVLPEAVAGVGVGLAGAALFGGSQFTETYDKAIKAGKSPEQARTLGLQTGAIEGAGEAIATPVLGRFVRGAGSLLGGGKATIPAAIEALKNPAFLKDFGKLMLETSSVETATEMGQAYGEAAVEKGAGIASEDPYHAAVAAIGPTLAMTALLGPFAGRGLRQQQNTNKLLVDQATTPDPNLSPVAQLAQVDKAVRGLQPVLGRMVGENEATEWALQQLEQTVKSTEEQTKAAQMKAQQEQEQQTQEANAKAAEQARIEQNAAQGLEQQRIADGVRGEVDQSEVPGLANVPGVQQRTLPDTLTATQYQDMWGQLLEQRDVAGFDQQVRTDLPAVIGKLRAPQDAATAQQAVAVQRSEADQQAAVAQAIINPPAGAMTFGQFAESVMKARKQPGELRLKGGRPSESALRDAYVSYMNEHLRSQEQSTAGAQIGTPEGQGTLDLDIAHPAEVSYQVPAQSVRTNMTEAMVRAQRLKQTADAAAATEAEKQAQLDKLQNIGRGTRQAEQAESGQITGNTPIDLSGLQNGWAETAAANGMKAEAVVGEQRALIAKGFKQAAGQKLFVSQINILRNTRDKLTKNSEARDSLDAFITRLEGKKNGDAQAAPEVDQGTKPERPQVQVPSGSVQGTQRNAAANTQGTQQKASDVIPEAEQRPLKKGADPYSLQNYRFEFENYKYTPTANPTEPINHRWLKDYESAYNLAAGLSIDGVPLTKLTERAAKQQQNAKAALAWLEKREPNIEDTVKVARARLKGIMEVNNRARMSAQDALTKLSKQIKHAMAQKLGRNIDELTPEELADAQQEYDETLNSSAAYRNSFNKLELDQYRYDNNIELAVRTRSVDNVLQAVETSPYAEWAQPLVDRLRALNLKTTIAPGLDTVKNATEQDKRGSAGAYDHETNWIGIGERGFNVHTVLHELEHAATVGHYSEGVHADQVPDAERTAAQNKAVADLHDLRSMMEYVREQVRDSKGNLPYALKNEREFLAEVRSNQKFQETLRGIKYADGRSMWDRFVSWVQGVFGMPNDPVFRNALEHAISLAERFETGSRFSLWDHINYSGPQVDALRTDSLLQTASSEWEKALQRYSALGNVGQTTTRAMLQAFTTKHILKWIEKSPSLQAIAPGIRSFFAADAVKTKLIQDKSAEFYQPTKALQQALQSIPSAERAAMQKELSILASEMSGLNVDLNKDYAANLTTNPALERSTQMKAYVNDMHARYAKLPAALKIPLEQTFAVNRKNFIQQTTTSLRNYLSTFSDARTGRWISRLDIRDPALDAGAPIQNAAGKLPYYLDRYTANLDTRLQTIFKEIADAKLGKEFNEIQRFYSSAVGNPYQHLARMGTNFVEFTLKPTAEALARVQQALSPFNVVIGQPTAGNQHVFMRFENPAQRDEAERVMKALDGVATEPGTVRGGSLANRGDIDQSRGVPQFARSMIKQLEATFDATVAGRTPQERALVEEMHQSIKRWALDAVPDTSARKALAQRNVGGRTLGYEADFVRNFTTRAGGMISNLANAYSLPLFSDAFADIKKNIEPLAAQNPKLHSEAQMVHDEIAQRFTNSLNPVDSPIIDGIKAFGYNFYLALSPSFWLVNLAQPYHLTLPYLGGRYGFIQSAKAMGDATSKALSIVKDTLATGIAEGKALGGLGGAILGVLDAKLVTGTGKLSIGEAAFIHALAASGQLDSTQSHELGRVAEGANPKVVAATKLASVGSYYTEVVNRLTAGLAAFNLEFAKSKDQGKAIARGVAAVEETQFDYSDRNTARAFGRHGVAGKVTPLLASFQQYSFQTTELLIRMVRDATFSVPANATEQQRKDILDDRAAAQQGLLGILGTTTVIAGTLGLPAANVAARVLDALIGDDDDPSDVKSAYRAWLADFAGKDVAEALSRGVPRALLGLDTSARAGLQDILPGSRFFTDRRQLQDKIKDGALNMLGPAVSAGVDLTTGISHMLDGRVMDGLTEMLPLSLRGPAKAFKMSQVGYTNATGNQIPIPVTGWDEFVQSLGFTPAKKAEQSEANFAFKTRDSLLKQEKAKLSNNMYIAIERKGSLSPEQQQTLNEWNMKNPQYKIDVGAGLAARAKARGVAEVSGTDIDALPRNLPTLERYSYANTR